MTRDPQTSPDLSYREPLIGDAVRMADPAALTDEQVDARYAAEEAAAVRRLRRDRLRLWAWLLSLRGSLTARRLRLKGIS